MIQIRRSHRLRRIVTLCGALLLTASAVAGCGNSSSADEKAPVSSGDAKVELNGLLPRLTAEDRYQIGYTLPQFRDPFWVSVAYGIEDEAKKSGVDVVVSNEAGSYANLGEQLAQVDDMTQRGLDAVLVAPVDRVGIAPALDNAERAGIKVIGAGNLGSSPAMVAGVTFSHLEVGRSMADAIGEQLHGKGHVVMLNGPNGADWAMLRNEGFKEELAAKYPDVEIVEEAWVNPDRAAGQSTMEDWLQKRGDEIDAVFSAVSLTAEGAVLALRNAGRNGDVFVATSSLSSAARDMIKAGDIQFCYAEPGQLVGRLAVQYAIRAIEGKDLEGAEPAEGGEKYPEKVLYVQLPPITPDNVADFDPAVLDWAPDGFTPA
jgi:inositol transport system substrate-binding protein